MARRKRVDSAPAAVEIMAAATNELSPPEHIRLREGDLPFWEAVIVARARSEWSDEDLILAANLARAMADAEIYAGTIVGKPTVETVLSSLATSDKLARRIVTLRRALGIDSRAKQGEQRDVNKRREHARAVEAGHNPLADDDDGLLARPAGSA